MLTLQILDGGESFYRPLEGKALILGSAEDVDVRLTEAGVSRHHARLQPHGDTYKIVDLDSKHGTKVNGELVAQWLLELGDRVELGRAVVVLGQRVRRQATPKDVLDDEPVVSRTSVAMRQRSEEKKAGASMLLVAVLLVAVLGIVGLSIWSDDSDVQPGDWGNVETLCRQVEFGAARSLVERFRAEWGGGDAARHARLDVLDQRIDTFEKALSDARARIMQESRLKSRVQQLKELKALRKSEPESLQGLIAPVLLSELTELRLSAERFAPNVDATAKTPGPDSDPDWGTDQPTPTVAGDAEAETVPSAMGAGVESAGEIALRVREHVAAIRSLHEGAQYAQALEVLSQVLVGTPAEAAAPLRELSSELRTDIARKMKLLVDRAEQLASPGTLEGFDEAMTFLRRESVRFPTSGAMSVLQDGLDALEQRRTELAMVDEARAEALKTPTAAELGDLLAEIHSAERDGNYAKAAESLALASDRMRAKDPLYSRNLDGRKVDFELLAGLSEYVATSLKAEAKPVSMRLLDGSEVVVRQVRDHRLVAGEGETGVSVAWESLAPSGLRGYLRRLKAEPRVLAGVAVLAYRSGQRDAAESLLVEVLAKDRSLLLVLNGVISRGRGEGVDSRGYQLVKGEFVAVRLLEAEKRSRRLESELKTLLARPAKKRAARIEEILAEGPEVLDALVLALRRQHKVIAARISAHAFRKHYDHLRDLRLKLDSAREFAKELIYDELRYFYPYRPPAVSGARASEYWKVQSEVDERVAAVRKLWGQKASQKRIPPKLFSDVERLDVVAGLLRDFGEDVGSVAEDVAWTGTLPSKGKLGLQNFALTASERYLQRLFTRVHAWNDKQWKHLTRAEINQVKITNAYREMFGHRPLAVNMKLHESSRGHAVEMARLGYFSHFSKTQGRETPFDRMRLAGYHMGASENIAKHPTAQSAHNGWIRSSGHHRNLLMASHEEFAVGSTGNYWVQNFGRGDEYLRDAEFPAEK